MKATGENDACKLCDVLLGVLHLSVFSSEVDSGVLFTHHLPRLVVAVTTYSAAAHICQLMSMSYTSIYVQKNEQMKKYMNRTVESDVRNKWTSRKVTCPLECGQVLMTWMKVLTTTLAVMFWEMGGVDEWR